MGGWGIRFIQEKKFSSREDPMIGWNRRYHKARDLTIARTKHIVLIATYCDIPWRQQYGGVHSSTTSFMHVNTPGDNKSLTAVKAEWLCDCCYRFISRLRCSTRSLILLSLVYQSTLVLLALTNMCPFASVTIVPSRSALHTFCVSIVGFTYFRWCLKRRFCALWHVTNGIAPLHAMNLVDKKSTEPLQLIFVDYPQQTHTANSNSFLYPLIVSIANQ